MIKWLKKYFIPHADNKHHPHFLRKEGRLFVFFLVLASQILLVSSVLIFSKTNLLAEIFPDILVNEANSSRSEEGLSVLKVNPLLVKAAQMKAEDMAKKGYFAHESPEGITPWFWLGQAGYSYSYAGENLAVNFFDSKDLADAWMNSPLHRANIMNKNFTEIGIATARGTYKGKEAVFVVQFFGKPQATSMARSAPRVLSEEIGLQNQNSENSVMEFKAPISNVIQNVAASPRRTANYIQWTLLLLVVISLILATFVEMHIQKTAPLASGLLMVAIIGGVIYVNHMAGSMAQIF